MKKLKQLFVFLIIPSLALTLMKSAEAQSPSEMATFFDSEVPGIKVQVNGTAEAIPADYVNITLKLIGQADVYLKHFNLSIFGFINGTEKTLMTNITDNNIPLDNDSREYNHSFTIPEDVWGVTYGELILTYSAKYDIVTVDFEALTCGFTLTNIENVRFKDMKEQLESLNDAYQQLNTTYWELQQNYTSLQENLGQLESTRQAVIALAVVTIFFVATTVYLIVRKPKQTW
ncbi:MAG: hypothetical protein QHH18_05495 [Candidatus Bathyarchaeota archaeon]|jgi:hypothetical protein|nr:hypothetical protein [Candidatus Bathyarchaeota archaeon A05DMB-5]MDH7558043.1 hypothetical protein [Candidatus Bathyarchaeota archaeon]